MSSQSSSLPPESRAFDLIANRVGYAFVNPQYIIESTTGIIQTLSFTPEIDIVNQPVTEAFVELFGYEETLDQLLSGEVPFLELQEIEIARYRSGLIPEGWVQQKLESIGLASSSSIKPLQRKPTFGPQVFRSR